MSLVIILCLLVGSRIILTHHVFAGGGDEMGQTIPTRTPRPPDGENPPPEDDGDDDDDGDSDSEQPQPPAPSATPTAAAGSPQTGQTPTRTIAVPEGGFVTPESCAAPVFQASVGRVNVRSGPGTDYDVLDQLVYLEVREIIGRAGHAQWWLLTLADGTQGWVADSAGTVFGYASVVPLSDPPALNGATPTPGPVWNPTPNAECPTLTPSPTPTEIPIETPTATATPAGQEVQAGAAGDPTEEPTATPEPPTATPTDEPTEAPTATNPVPTPTPLSTPAATDNGSGLNWMLFAGLGLLVLGAIFFAVSRR